MNTFPPRMCQSGWRFKLIDTIASFYVVHPLRDSRRLLSRRTISAPGFIQMHNNQYSLSSVCGDCHHQRAATGKQSHQIVAVAASTPSEN